MNRETLLRLAEESDRMASRLVDLAKSLRAELDVQPELFEVKTPKFDPMEMALPFTDDEYRKAWCEFVTARKERRKPLTKLSAQRLCLMLNQHTWEAGVWALKKSATMGWQGVFPENYKGDGAAPKSFARQDEEQFQKNLLQNAMRGTD